MKKRDEIEKQINILWKKNPETTYEYLILQALLDIRELLEEG